MADNLFAILAHIRGELPDVPDAAWDRLQSLLSEHAGASDVYVPAQRKRSHLAAIAEAGNEPDDVLARRLGVGIRRVQQLRKILKIEK